MKITARFLGLACVCLASMPLAAKSVHTPLTLLPKRPLPEFTGTDFDLSVDLPHSRLDVLAEEHRSIEVFSLPTDSGRTSLKLARKSSNTPASGIEGHRRIIS